MSNCLITKLNATVDDKNIPVLNEMIFTVLPFIVVPTSGWLVPFFQIGSRDSFYVEILSDSENAYMTNSDGTANYGKKQTFSANSIYSIGFNTPATNDDAYKVRVVSKNEIYSYTSSGYCRIGFNINDFQYCTEFNVISISNQSVPVYGNIENIDFSINPSQSNNIYTPYTMIEGRIEVVLEKLYRKGKRSGSISIQMFEPAQPNLTFGGKMMNTNARKNIICTFSSNSITVVDTNGEGNTIGVYNGSSWTYPN